MEVDAAYHGCLPSCELHSTSLAVGRTVACGSWDCAHVLRNPEIACSVSGFQECATQSRDCTNFQIARNIYTCAQCYTYCSICSPYYAFGACFPPWAACCSVTSFKAALPDPIVSKSLYSVNHPQSQWCRRIAHPPLRWIYLPFCLAVLECALSTILTLRAPPASSLPSTTQSQRKRYGQYSFGRTSFWKKKWRFLMFNLCMCLCRSLYWRLL